MREHPIGQEFGPVGHVPDPTIKIVRPSADVDL